MPPARWRGRELRPGQLVTHGPDAEADHRSARNCDVLGINVSVASLCDAARALLKVDGLGAIDTWSASTRAPEVTAKLEAQARRLLMLDARALQSNEGYLLEQAVLRTLVEATIVSPGQRTRDLPLAARATVVRRADEIMRANLTAPVGALELCSALGVSDRTLRLAFRERFGIGPMVYFRALRLNAVRQSLLKGKHRPIADVAHQFGFYHLGNFAADYRRWFGEVPSATRHGVG